MDAEGKELSLKLEEAVGDSNVDLLKFLLKKKLELKCLEGALVKASAANNVDVVQLLLDHVESLNVTDALWIVFRTASEFGKEAFIKLTVAIKLCDKSVPSTALCWVAGHGHNDLIKPLLDNGADVNSTGIIYGHTALRAAAENGQVDCLTTLIEHGADVNAGTGDLTPLHCAAGCGHTECVTALLRHGADINSRNILYLATHHFTGRPGVVMLTASRHWYNLALMQR